MPFSISTTAHLHLQSYTFLLKWSIGDGLVQNLETGSVGAPIFSSYPIVANLLTHNRAATVPSALGSYSGFSDYQLKVVCLDL